MGHKQPAKVMQDRSNRDNRHRKPKFVKQNEDKVKSIVAQTPSQKPYLHSLQFNTFTVGKGAAGTGKTYGAAAVAAIKYMRGEIDSIVVTRPYVGMGKSSGFWPGTIEDKLMPYLLPILNTIRYYIGDSKFEADFGKKILIQPMESVRGMSFKDRTYVIVDEAQNCSVEEIRSLVTRPEEGCQMAFCGDDSQKDVSGVSGITYMAYLIKTFLTGEGEGAVVEFTADDCVRAGVVKRLIHVFDEEGPASNVKEVK